jgi:hypothetical protein
VELARHSQLRGDSQIESLQIPAFLRHALPIAVAASPSRSLTGLVGVQLSSAILTSLHRRRAINILTDTFLQPPFEGS